MPPRFSTHTNHEQRADWCEDVLRNLEEAACMCSSVSCSLEDDGQKQAGEPWESAASEMRELINKIRILAR